MCKKDMVYAAIVVDSKTLWVWMCNCRPQPEWILADIENARLDPATNLVYELEIVNG